MSRFSSSWLALREPVDVEARSVGLAVMLGSLMPKGHTIRCVDLGGGTGANVRYLAEQLGGPQEWLIVDRDDALLAEVPRRMREWAKSRGYALSRGESGWHVAGKGLTCGIVPRHADLNAAAEEAIGERVVLVTASALLDLVSSAWLKRVVARCQKLGAAVLFALNYDGRIACSPEEPEDEIVRDLVNAHQRTDKGFGRALGPDAVRTAERLFRAMGYEVRSETSEWKLGQAHRTLQQALIEGWAGAASAMAPRQRTTIQEWRDRRLAHVAAGRSAMTVGHRDLAAWTPISSRSPSE